eukprot:2607539-Karenia_brevis.AAC.1
MSKHPAGGSCMGGAPDRMDAMDVCNGWMHAMDGCYGCKERDQKFQKVFDHLIRQSQGQNEYET